VTVSLLFEKLPNIARISFFLILLYDVVYKHAWGVEYVKFLKVLLVILIVFGVLGYAVYYFGTNIASEKVMETISTELENSGEMENIKTAIESDPELMTFVEEAEAADPEDLPFTTKEEATRVLIQKVGLTELNDLRVQAQEGTVSKEEIISKMEASLSEDEILALKVVAYKELYGE
jgi:preprotein translocase subunit Sss1